MKAFGTTSKDVVIITMVRSVDLQEKEKLLTHDFSNLKKKFSYSGSFLKLQFFKIETFANVMRKQKLFTNYIVFCDLAFP